MRAVIYARVSTEEQTHNFSIENQLERLRKYCEERNWKVVKEYVDAGYSGRTTQRPELKELMEDAKQQIFDLVVVYKLDRLFRSARHLYNTLAEWEELGISLVSATEPFDTSTAMGKAYLGMASTFAEWEANTFAERSYDGIRKAVEKGRYSGGIIPFGYKLNPQSKELEVEEDEASIIRMMYYWLNEERLSCHSIAQRLNAMGIPTRYKKDGRGIRGKETAGIWRAGRVYNLLRSAIYKGVFIYGKRSKKANKTLLYSKCPPIIDEATWEKAQRRLKENNLWADRNSKRQYLLRGFITCDICGHRYVGTVCHSTRNGELRYYKCDRKHQCLNLLSGKCNSPTIRADWLEEIIWGDISEFIQKPEVVRKALEVKLSDFTLNYDEELSNVEKRIRELLEAERRLLRLYADPRSNFSKEALDAEIKFIATSREIALKLKKEIEEAKKQKEWERKKLEEVENLLHRLRERIKEATFEEKRYAIEALLQEVRVGRNEDGLPKVKIVYAFEGQDYVGLYSARMPLWLFWRPGKAMYLFPYPCLSLSKEDKWSLA